MKIAKTEIKDGICLVTAWIKGNVISTLDRLKKEMKERNAQIYYSYIHNMMNKEKKLIIASNDRDIYPLLASMGCLRDDITLKGYTLCSCNTLITWEKTSSDIFEFSKDIEDKIQLVFENDKRGCIICESQIKHKIIACIEDI